MTASAAEAAEQAASERSMLRAHIDELERRGDDQRRAFALLEQEHQRSKQALKLALEEKSSLQAILGEEQQLAQVSTSQSQANHRLSSQANHR